MSFESINLEGDRLSKSLFGGNVLANRNGLFEEGGYADAIDDLSITDLRYPGGSLTEYYFDIANPNSSTATHSETGEVKSMIPLSDFLNYAANNNHSVTIVLPTRHYIDDTSDENGDRFALIDEEELRTFVRDVASGKYGDAAVSAFEIGNEYWHSGDMTSIEYGRIAAKMTEVIDDEIEQLSSTVPDAAHIDVIVQMGYNAGTADFNDTYDHLDSHEAIQQIETAYDLVLDEDAVYSGGGINFYNISNEMIIQEFEKLEVVDAVDGVVSHVYSWGPEVESSRSYLLNQVDKTWLEEIPDIEIYVTEWNIRGFSDGLEEHEDYGLYQASEMLEMMETFVQYGVDQANVWPLIQSTDNALSQSNTYENTNAPGAFFKMMSENLPGKVLLDFNPYSQMDTEADFENFSVHGFADSEELVLYMTTNHKEGVVETNLDLNELVTGFDTVEISILGVEYGEASGSNESAAQIESVDPREFSETGFLDLPLDPGEIVQVVVRGYDPTEELAIALGLSILDEEVVQVEEPAAVGDAEFDLPTVPVDEATPDGMTYENEDYDVDGDDFGLSWLLALLPLLGLAGMAGM